MTLSAQVTEVVTVQMRLEKETKGAVRYEDIRSEAGDSAIPTLYVRKDAFPDGKYPESIVVTVCV